MKKEINEKEKELLAEQLKKTPIIMVACEKIGVPRSTFYRWRKSDQEFSRNVDDAILVGSQLVNDLAESQLISSIKDKNLTAIIFWLKHHHHTYEKRVNINGRLQTERMLTPEEQECIKKALELSRLTKDKIN